MNVLHLLRSRSPAWRSGRHVPSDGSWRDVNPELEEELGRNPFLTPRAIRGRHGRDQLTQFRRNRRPSGRPRLPTPEQPESLAVPPKERLRLDDGQQTLPIDEPRKGDEREARRIIRTAWLRLPFQIKRQLLSQEQVLCGELGT